MAPELMSKIGKACAALGLLLAVVTVCPGVYLYGSASKIDGTDLKIYIGFGVFNWVVPKLEVGDSVSVKDDVRSYDCDMWDALQDYMAELDPNYVRGPAPKCAAKQESECKAQKAFGLIGIFTGAAALGLSFASMGPIPAVAAAGVAAFSEMLVWTLAASYYNTKPSETDFDESCGFNSDDDGSDRKYGGAFVCSLLATFIFIMAAALLFIGGRSGYQKM